MTDSEPTARRLYLELIKGCLMRSIFDRHYHQVQYPAGSLRRLLYGPIRRLLAWRSFELVKTWSADARMREEGRDWPLDAETMIGRKRLDNIQSCVEDVLREKVPGDLVETGVWRGGATIFMRALLKAYDDRHRIVWAADSFQGLPTPDPKRYRADAGDRHWSFANLAVPLEAVKANFARYGLLDDQVRFLVGWFRDTLFTAPIGAIAVLRLDGDMYESTMDALTALYPKLSVGGYLIVDDYQWVPGCKQAVDDFRARQGITEAIEPIDWQGVFWRRTR